MFFYVFCISKSNLNISYSIALANFDVYFMSGRKDNRQKDITIVMLSVIQGA